MSVSGAGARAGSALPVVVDAMGGDDAPAQPVAGGVSAVRELGIPVVLVGRADELERIVRGLGGPFPGLTIIDAPEVVQMEEQAVSAVRRKSHASISVAMEELKAGRASALVSAGNSGAVVAAAVFGLGRVPGIERPALGMTLPALGGRRVLVLDAGAVADPRPIHLVQYAYLATIYLQQVEGIARPQIGLLSNGSEPGKGNALVREAYHLLSADPTLNFYGNIEANEMPYGRIDAVVCDGFTGNVVLKTAEGVVTLVQDALRAELTANWRVKFAAALLRPALRRVAKRLDYREYGGVPLLGVNGVVIMAHGRSDSRAIRSAVAVAHRAGASDFLTAMARGVGPSVATTGHGSDAGHQTRRRPA